MNFLRRQIFRIGESGLGKGLKSAWIARNMAGDKVGDIPAILHVLLHPLMTESEIEKRQQVVTASCENSS